MQVNIKISSGTKRAINHAKVKRQEDKLITKIDWYAARKAKRKMKCKKKIDQWN